MVVSVQKGGQPVYYCAGRPYVRHLRESRPAEPNEVIELIQKWAGFDSVAPGGVEVSSDSIWHSELGQILVEILIAADEYPARCMAPWVDYLQSDCERWASSLRDLIHEYLQREEHLATEIRSFAEQCDEMASILQFPSSSTWPQVAERMPEIQRKAADLKKQLIDELPLSADSERVAKETIVLSARKARDLVGRSDRLMGFRIDELKDEASSIGEEILRIAMYPLPFLADKDAEALRQAGRQLHLVDTIPVYLDGGASGKKLAEQIVRATEGIETVAAKVDSV